MWLTLNLLNLLQRGATTKRTGSSVLLFQSINELILQGPSVQ